VALIPRAVYRLQLTPGFGFDAAAQLTPYLAALGVSHVYCSPILQSAPGSDHGYDVVDPTRIDSELGGEDGFDRLVEAARTNGLGLVVDIVPNHMATAGRANPWWWDVLEHGPASRYARYFDVDWDPWTSAVKDRIVLGVLGDRYGRELESGALTIAQTADGLVVRYHEHDFPIAPETAEVVDAVAVQRDPDALDALLERQHYRLSYWRTAQTELNYRRFFTIDTLIGLRVEDPRVFEDSHRAVLRRVAAGAIAGLRVDHVDGLRDPAGYLAKLRAAAPDAYIVAEKILAPAEALPPGFDVSGTTGYDFIAAVEGLFVAAENEEAMTGLYHAFTGESQPFREVAHTAKLEVLDAELGPDLDRLTAQLVAMCDADRNQRDRTRREVRAALREVAAGLRVYRTYVTSREPASETDRREIQAAIDEAARRRPDIDPDLLAFVRDALLLDRRGAAEEELTARFQQLTPAVMAKGVEDTAFYRYHRLISLNEVGGDPGRFGTPVDAFHEWCARIARATPHTMLTVTTHDTKRSADVRARVDVLSELPAEWESAVRRWADHNDRHRAEGFPDRNLEYLAYQTLAGAWPLDAGRLAEFLRKAAREAGTHTSWTDPVAAYEDAVDRFAHAILADAEFTTDLESFLGRHEIVARGHLTSLAQTALLLTAPGVPDLYQGTELWALLLVDPDNRRPVDFAARAALLEQVGGLDAADLPDDARKLWLITRVLGERARRPDVFEAAQYAPLTATGAKARHLVAFSRGRLLVLVPRLVVGLAGGWADTEVELPAGPWTNILTGATEPGGREARVAALLDRFPIAVMTAAR
jgi:(1->4)-alpha-D-glucan 1-alpha-D-glucosylmutase